VIQITMQFDDEPCRRLIATGMLPGRAAQPTQIILHMTLSQLRDLPGASAVEAAWAAARASPPRPHRIRPHRIRPHWIRPHHPR
jgi:hypothetical protein